MKIKLKRNWEDMRPIAVIIRTLVCLILIMVAVGLTSSFFDLFNTRLLLLGTVIGFAILVGLVAFDIYFLRSRIKNKGR